MIRSTRLFPLILTLCLLALVGPAWGQSTSIVPEDATFALSVKPSALYQSELGKRILDFIREKEPKIDQSIDDLCTTVGIDLRNALGETVIYGTGYDKQDFALVADIGPTAGNINGLLLAAPGYDSSVYQDKLIIHSLPTEGRGDQPDRRVFCAMPKRPGSDSYLLVAAFDPARVRQMIDQAMDSHAEMTPQTLKSDALIEAWFTGLPDLARLADAQGPPSVWARMIDRAHLTVAENDQGLDAQLDLTMIDDLRAQQVAQLMQGGLAMLQLIATNEPKAQPLADFAQLVKVNHTEGDLVVSADLTCSFDQFDQLIAQLKEHQAQPAPAVDLHVPAPQENTGKASQGE